MATSPPQQTPLAAGVNDSVKAELGRRDVKPAQIMEWTGIRSAQTVRDRRAGRSDWTLAELDALGEAMGIRFTLGVFVRE